MAGPLPGLLLCLGTLGGCGQESDAPAGGGTADAQVVEDDGLADAAPYGFEIWHADFPGAPKHPEISPRVAGRTYARTRNEAIDSVVANLQGNCSRNAWLFARDVFRRASGERVVQALIEALDAGLQSPLHADHAENCLEALAQVGDPRAAPAILRALDHRKEALREEAMKALLTCGDAETMRRAWSLIDRVTGRGRTAWIRAAVRHLPVDEYVPMLQQLLVDPRYPGTGQVILEEAVKLEPAVALRIFEPLIRREPPELRATLAILRHLTGDGGGSALFRDLLKQAAPQARISALQALRLGGAKDFFDDLLRLSDDPDPQVRLEAVKTLAEVPGDEANLALEARTIDEFVDVRRAALSALAFRGFNGPLEELVDVVKNGTGSVMQAALEDLVAARYVGTVPAVVERLKGTSGLARESLLRSMAVTTCAEAFVPLRDEYLSADPESVALRRFVAYTMANCRGAEFAMLELFDELPDSDYLRRGQMLTTLANVAADRDDVEIKRAIYDRLRALLKDRSEIPQMRLLALEYLRRDLTFDDVVPLRAFAAEEDAKMKAAIGDFLFEFF